MLVEFHILPQAGGWLDQDEGLWTDMGALMARMDYEKKLIDQAKGILANYSLT